MAAVALRFYTIAPRPGKAGERTTEKLGSDTKNATRSIAVGAEVPLTTDTHLL